MFDTPRAACPAGRRLRKSATFGCEGRAEPRTKTDLTQGASTQWRGSQPPGRAISLGSPLMARQGLMNPTTRIQLDDVNGQPMVLLGDVPTPLRIGDPLWLRFRLLVDPHGRPRALDVNGRFRVTAVGFDLSVHPPRQLLTVETALGKPPTWTSPPRKPPRPRLTPAVHPRTPVM